MRTVARLGLLIVLLAGLLFIAGFPARTYMSQRHDLAMETERLQVLTDSNRKLEARVGELHTDEAIERLAREQYNLVRPGEEAYAILPGPVAPSATAPGSGAEGAADDQEGSGEESRGFWSGLWDAISFWS